MAVTKPTSTGGLIGRLLVLLVWVCLIHFVGTAARSDEDPVGLLVLPAYVAWPALAIFSAAPTYWIERVVAVGVVSAILIVMTLEIDGNDSSTAPVLYAYLWVIGVPVALGTKAILKRYRVEPMSS